MMVKAWGTKYLILTEFCDLGQCVTEVSWVFFEGINKLFRSHLGV